MSAKAFLILCAQALLVKSAFSQCAAGLAGPWGLGGPAGPWGLAGPAGWNGLAAPGLGAPALAGGYGAGCGCGGVASTGGGFPVTSVSPIAPTGVSVVSENAYEGALAAGGNLPFLGTVALDGVLPTAGAGAVSYGCGNDAVAMVSEGPISTGILTAEAFTPAAGLAGYGLGGIAGYGYDGFAGYGPGIGGLGCGCGGLVY